jgi:hypothetical protein
MSIILAPASLPYPPGITGDPYTPDDISKFYDLNWPPMYTGVKSTGFVSPGLLGLGQACAASECLEYADGACDSWDDTPCSTQTIPNPLLGTSTTPAPITGVNSGNCVVGGIDPANGFQILSCSGGTITSELNPSSSGTITGTPNQAQYTPAQLAAIIAAGGNSAVSIIRTAAGGPYTVAGTNLVYNPATGQLSSGASGLPAGLSSLSAYIPYIALAIGAIVILPMLTGKK